MANFGFLLIVKERMKLISLAFGVKRDVNLVKMAVTGLIKSSQSHNLINGKPAKHLFSMRGGEGGVEQIVNGLLRHVFYSDKSTVVFNRYKVREYAMITRRPADIFRVNISL